MGTVLLTGASGFLGRPCLERLLKAGWTVHAAARHPVRELESRLHECDLLDPKSAAELVAAVRPTHLLHLAWIATPGQFWTSPDNDRWVEASLALYRAFQQHGGRRAVLIGTCAEYDWSHSVCDEKDTPLRPVTRYGNAKLTLWKAIEALQRPGDSAAWARLFFLYGPGEHPARLVASVIRSLLLGGEARCTSGTQRRDFMHVDDAADALVALLGSGVQGAVNIGSGLAVPVSEVVGLIGAMLGATGRLHLGALPTPATEPAHLQAGLRRLRGELGWQPSIGLLQGLQSAIDWWSARPQSISA